MRLALEALEQWNTNPLYKPYFHQTGMLFAEDIGMGDASFANYKTVGVDPHAEILTPEQARERFPFFKEANWTDVKDNYYNPCSGWGEADPAMRAMMQATLDLGVEYVQAVVETLIFDDHGACLGVKTVEGDEMKVESVLLCTGAGTAKLIADSAPHNSDIQVNGRMVAAAATACIVQCDDEYQSMYRDAPVHFLGMPHTHGEHRS
jgi:sarcosine oxidase/L-pipecolate oxidase